MATCGECKLLTTNPKGGYKCLGKRCGATKMTPETNASRCTKFEPK